VGSCQVMQVYRVLREASSNHVPWAIITACFVVSAALLLVLRFMLSSENRRRDAARRDKKYDEVYVTQIKDGATVEKKVDRVRACLNRHTVPLRYPTGFPWLDRSTKSGFPIHIIAMYCTLLGCVLCRDAGWEGRRSTRGIDDQKIRLIIEAIVAYHSHAMLHAPWWDVHLWWSTLLRFSSCNVIFDIVL